jgi:hypothetical protein
MERVKFYSISDFGCGYQLQRAEAVLNEFDEKISITDVNDILELFNIKQFFEQNAYLTTWSESDITRYKGIVGNFQKMIGRFFSDINNIMMIFGSYLNR